MTQCGCMTPVVSAASLVSYHIPLFNIGTFLEQELYACEVPCNTENQDFGAVQQGTPGNQRRHITRMKMPLVVYPVEPFVM